MFCGNKSISGNEITQLEWDLAPIDGIYVGDITIPIPSGLISLYVSIMETYAGLSGNPLCNLSANPKAVTCPVKLKGY
jgi:hypothetical protein